MRKDIPFLVVFLLIALCMSAITPVSAAPAATPPKPPIRTIPVTGNGMVDVVTGAVNNFVMKDGDLVIIPQMTVKGLKASFSTESIKTLPTTLPEGFSFVDGYSVSLINSGKAVDVLPGKQKLTVSFEQDAEWLHCDGDAVITILHWSDENGWQEVGVNSLEASSNHPGIFVLAKR
jgi:hypothetical protein